LPKQLHEILWRAIVFCPDLDCGDRVDSFGLNFKLYVCGGSQVTLLIGPKTNTASVDPCETDSFPIAIIIISKDNVDRVANHRINLFATGNNCVDPYCLFVIVIII